MMMDESVEVSAARIQRNFTNSILTPGLIRLDIRLANRFATGIFLVVCVRERERK